MTMGARGQSKPSRPMTEDDPLVVTMTCFDCDEHVLVTVPGAQTAVRKGAHQDKPFRTAFTAECPQCAADMSRAVTLWVEGPQIMLELNPLPPR